MMSTTMETTYYQSGSVLITSTRAEMAGRTFVMSNITSVSLVEIPPTPGCIIALLLGLSAGVVLAVLGFVTILISGISTSTASLIFLGVFFALFAFLWLRSLKTEYAVNLMSASGENRVVQSTDRKRIEEIVSAVKQAIIDSDVQKVEAVVGNQVSKAGDGILQRLELLKDMFESGVITAQDYEVKKAEILSHL